MTEEELKDEICEYVHNLHKVEPFNGFSYRDLRDVAEHFALPREKRIAELETRCNELFLQTCEQAEKIKELKDDNKVMADNYSKMEQKFYDNLTKAKELLNEFMRISKASDEDFEHDYSELIAEAEQFLSEVDRC